MFKPKEQKRRPVPCPRCGTERAVSEVDYARYFFAYRPYVCPKCACRFGPNHSERVVFIALGGLAILLGLYAKDFRALIEAQPETLTLATAGVVAITIGAALILKFANRMIAIPERRSSADIALHFLSHYILPLSLIFLHVAFKAAKQSGF